MSPSLSAIIFDLDGTLIDSLPDLVAAVNRMLAEWRRPPLGADAVKAMVGDGARSLVERAFAATGGPVAADPADLLARFMADYGAHSADTTRPWPGVPETLERLKGLGLALAVCTNKPSVATAQVLGKLDLARYFDVVVAADDAPALKPDPAHPRAVLDRLGIGPERAAMVGDHHNDIEAARGAGIRTVALSFGYAHGPIEDLGADLVIDDFRALPVALGLVAPSSALAAMVPAFRAEMVRDGATLTALIDAGADEALVDHLHAMRGKCAMFGAEDLAERLARLERAVADGAVADRAALVAAVAEGLERLATDEQPRFQPPSASL